MQQEIKYPIKLDRPVYRNILKRQRLYTIMEKADGALIWICGPAGYGKTTLISSYIDHKKTPSIWYQWDNGDRDPATFYHYLGMACRKETPEKKIPIPSYGPEYASNPDVFSQRFCESLFERLEPPSLIVFDNLVEPPEEYFQTMLHAALSRIPSGFKIAVVSRTEPPSTLAILGVRNQMKVIRTEDLRLDFAEFSKAAALFGIGDLSEEKLRQMHQKVEGWFAGLMLMAESYRRTGRDPEDAKPPNTEDIYSFFAGEIERTINPETRDFLIKTSFLPHITTRAARLLTEYDECEDVLKYLASHNLFAARKDTEPVTFQYHSLFREYLQKQAAKTMDAEELAKIKKKAAIILRDAGQYEHAAALFAESNIWEDLTLLIIQNAPEILRQGRHQVLEEWLTGIPGTILSENRYLQFWLGCCRFPFSPGGSRPHFLQCLKLARAQGDAEMTYRAWSSTVETILFEFNNLYELDGLIKEFHEIRGEFPDYPSRDTEANVASSMLTALVFRKSEHPEIGAWAHKAVSLAKEKGISDDLIMVGLIEAMRHFYKGNMLDMRITIETLVEPFDRQEIGISLRSLVYYLLSLKECTSGLLDQSSQLVQAGLEASRETGVHLWDILLLGQGATCALTRGDMKTTNDYLDKMSQRLHQASMHDQSHYHYLSAWRDYLNGNMPEAANHARKAYELKVKVGVPFGIGTNRLALAETLWATGDKTEALKLLGQSRETAEQSDSGLLAYMCDIAEISFHLDAGDKKKALQTLKSAFVYGSALGIYNFFWLRKEALSRICSLAIENKVVLGYAQELIRRHQLVPDGSAQELEEWPWPVKLYTLGRFELVVQGKKISFPRKSQEKPVSLLKAIAALGGRKVSSVNLAEALWPDSDGQTAQQNLATTLHRLRKIIDIEDAVIFSKGNLTLNPKVLWVDMWAVERAMGRLGPALEKNLNNKKEEGRISPELERSLELYKGHFLSNDGSETWSITPRERLRSKYIRNLLHYCSYLERQGEHETAVRWYRKALELEHLAEELYQGLIRCYHRIGRKADAITTYNRCKQVLSDILGVEPSPETEAIRVQVLGES